MMDISTTTANRVKVLSANSTAGAFTVLNETIVDPISGAGVINMAGKNSMMLWPFGTDADGEEFDMKAILWWPGMASWGYTIGFLGTCTLSTKTGVANADIGASDLFCDTIAYTAGISPYSIQNGGTNEPSLLRIDTLGAQYVQIDFDNSSTATSSNAMAARI